MAFGIQKKIGQIGRNIRPHANSVHIHHLLYGYFFYKTDIFLGNILRSEVMENFLLRPFMRYVIQNDINQQEARQIMLEALERFVNKIRWNTVQYNTLQTRLSIRYAIGQKDIKWYIYYHELQFIQWYGAWLIYLKEKRTNLRKIWAKGKRGISGSSGYERRHSSCLLTKKNPTSWMKDNQKSQPCDFLWSRTTKE